MDFKVIFQSAVKNDYVAAFSQQSVGLAEIEELTAQFPELAGIPVSAWEIENSWGEHMIVQEYSLAEIKESPVLQLIFKNCNRYTFTVLPSLVRACMDWKYENGVIRKVVNVEKLLQSASANIKP